MNEVHNNTQNMIVRGFNQEGGKVTGNINNLEVTSLQNTSTTTGSSRGVSLGIGANGIPNSIGLSGSNTNGSRAYVDNQTTFIIGEGSNLTVGRAENTGGIIGKEENSTFKIGEYTGKDLNNYDTMRTTGGSIGLQTGSVPVSNIGYNQDTRDKEGITRNTVVGNVEIGTSSGSPINRDLSKANETTRDESSTTNINIESQTIEYALNPTKFKEDIEKAKQEVKDVGRAISESINDRGDDNRNFFGQLSEARLTRTVDNISEERLQKAETQNEITDVMVATYRDLGYEMEVIYTTPDKAPQLYDENGKPQAGKGYVDKETGRYVILINTESEENKNKAGLIGTLAEEGSHIIGKLEGRQRETGTNEKGLESTGRATGNYFEEKYGKDNKNVELISDGKNYSNSDFGEDVGDRCPDLTTRCMMTTGDDRGQVIEANTSKNFRQRETEFNKIYQRMKYYCNSTGECRERNGVFVFNDEKSFYTYHSLFSKIGQRDRVKLDYVKKETITDIVKNEAINTVIDAVNLGNEAVKFVGGVSGAILEDMSYGAYKPYKIEGDLSYVLGEQTGHILSMIGGGIGTGGGKLLEGAGVLATPVTGGVSLVGSVAGVAVSGYSLGVIGTAAYNFSKNAKDMSKNPPEQQKLIENNSGSSDDSRGRISGSKDNQLINLKILSIKEQEMCLQI